MLATLAEPHVSLYQAACRTGISRHALLARIVRGELRAVVMGKHVFIAESALAQLPDRETADSPTKLQAR
jgi:hypothetical protein